MSFDTVEMAFRSRKVPPLPRLTLLYLAKYDEMPGFVPTVSRLAEDMERSVRQVQEDLRTLEKLGLISPIGSRNGGRGNPTHYQFHFEDWIVAKVMKDKAKNKRTRIANAKVIHIHTRQEVGVDELPDFLFKEVNG